MADLTKIPLDVLVLIFPYLDVQSFLSLSSTCKAFHQPSIRFDPVYWSYATRNTFRVPNQPVAVQNDGERWQQMYRRLLTQSRAFTWGNNSHHRLGHSYDPPVIRNPRLPGLRGVRRSVYCSFPSEMEDTKDLGVIADMQCGGWSTTILTSRGSLHTVGVMDGMKIMISNDRLQTLRFPPAYPDPTSSQGTELPATAIRQFSSGRSHILGLSDTGRIWSWYDVRNPALIVKFLDVDFKDTALPSTTAGSSLFGHAKQVIAGWACSSAYIYGYGIVIWKPISREREDSQEVDAKMVVHVEVPKTSYQRVKDSSRQSDEEKALGEEVGEVLNYILLEHFVVFATDIGKVFCGRMGEENKIDDIMELRALRNDNRTPLDVQGSFRRFAVFKNGEVITSNQDYLENCWNARNIDPEQTSIQGLEKIPALQQNNVISVAFGDYHFLALHSTGKITSYGTELQSCGALGLGGQEGFDSRLRGVKYRGAGQDGQLLPHAYTHGREVWFDTKKKEWIHFLAKGGKDPNEAAERMRLFNNDLNVQGEVSEWIEQEGREWDKDTSEDGLGAYFALRVSAAGWHSSAVVLVNDELASKEPSYSWQERSFPRLRLSNGEEMPGTVEFDEWRSGRPEWNLDLSI